MATLPLLLRFLLVLLFSIPPVTQAALPNAILSIIGDSNPFLVAFASFGERDTIQGNLVTLPPSNAHLCDNITTIDTVPSDSILFIPRGSCTFQQKAWNAQQLGAIGIVIYNTLESRYRVNETSGLLEYPLDKVDYECHNGQALLNDFPPLEPPTYYNGSYLDDLLTLDSPNNQCLIENPDMCASRKCLLTGPADNNTGLVMACCAWDISLTMGIDYTMTDQPIRIVSVFVTMQQASDLFGILDFNNTTMVRIQARPYPAFNVSSLFLWGMAIFIVWFASWWSVRDYRVCQRHWHARFQESIARHLQQQQQHRHATREEETINDNGHGASHYSTQATIDMSAQENHEPSGTCPNDPQEVTATERPDDLEARPSTQHDTLTGNGTTPHDLSTQDAVAPAIEPQEEESVVEPPTDDNENSPQQQHHPPQQQSHSFELNAWHAAGFVIVASSLLLLLFYFEIYTWVTVLYGIGCSGALVQVIFAPLYSWISRRCQLKWCFTSITSVRYCEWNTIQWVHVLAAISGYTLGGMWLYVGFTDDSPSTNVFYWITQDIMGASVSILFLSLLKLSSIKVATILLVAVFAYDVFFVFITPFFFHGNSVMVEVATGGGPPEASVDYCEKYPNDSKCRGGDPLPLLLTIPHVNDYRGGSSLLGLGDIVLPGLLIAFGARLDSARRLVGSLTNMNLRNVPKHWYNGYFLALIVAYAIGLLAANIAVVLMERGQPALLYIVPACLGTVFVKGRNELGELWRGPSVLQTADRIVRLDPNATSLRIITGHREGETEQQQPTTTISRSVRSLT